MGLEVLYYVGSFPKLSESFVLNEISELIRRGHDVAVFALSNPKEGITHDEHEDIDIPVYYANVSYIDFPNLLSQKSFQMAAEQVTDKFFTNLSPKQIGYNLLLGRRCSEFIESLEMDIDIIHSHFASTNRVGGMLAARHHNLPCTVTAHAAEIFKQPNPSRIRYICDGVDHVIVPSEYNRQYLREKIRIQNDITVVPATSQVKKFVPIAPTVENRLLTVARLIEKKGYPFAIEAVKNLVEQGFDIEYHVIGRGDMEEQLRQQVKRYGLEDNVEFLGHVSDETLRRELSEACVFLLPCIIAEDGDRDAMPVALKEAMASETACISTTVSAIPELITSGHDGLLVPPRRSDELATAIQDLFENTKMRQKIAQNGRNTVHTKFDISDSADTLLEVFEYYI